MLCFRVTDKLRVKNGVIAASGEAPVDQSAQETPLSSSGGCRLNSSQVTDTVTQT